MRKTVIVTMTLLVVFAHANAQLKNPGTLPTEQTSLPFNKAKLDSFFDLLEAKDKAMGSIAIARDGKPLYSRAIGYRQIAPGQNKKSTEATRYRIGSITKMFTATMIFQLIEEGKLNLDTKLDSFYASIPHAGKITIGHLLSHRSGIHNFTNDKDYDSFFTQPQSRQQMIDLIARKGSDFEPGTKASYSNSAFVLLGFIIEDLNKKPYAKSLQERITSRIGMQDTYTGSKISLDNNEAASFNYTGKWNTEPETDMSIPGGAGAIVSTSKDLTKFIEALFAGKLVTTESLAYMKQIKDRYGMGMIQFPFDDKTAYGHTGGIDGFNSMLSYFPAEKLAIAYCGNGKNYSVNNILIGALSVCFNRPFKIPEFATVNVSAEDLAGYVGIYSSETFPMKITITKKDNVLLGQATGQSAFPLEAVDKTKFKFEPAGIVIEFDAVKRELVLKQGGQSYKLTARSEEEKG